VNGETVVVLLVAPFIGSFLGVVIERLPEQGSIVFARSTCRHCKHVLSARDLIPLVSWVARRGYCGCGKVRLSAFYPGIELAALAVALSAVTVVAGWLLCASLALGWTLLTLAAIDLRHYLLPNVLTLPLVPAGLAVAWLIEPARVADHVVGAAVGLFGFALIAWLYRRVRQREGLGLGDAKLLAAGGAWLGWQALPSVVVVGAAAALAVALAGALAGSKLATTTRIAFGPYLALAIWLVWLYGPFVVG
jgi:leader peptidase (prepilin peptidase)/N-methyltransferase